MKAQVDGWVLVAREEDHATGIRSKSGPWYICWHEIFGRKKEALAFAKRHHWNPGYRAVRGRLAAA